MCSLEFFTTGPIKGTNFFPFKSCPLNFFKRLCLKIILNEVYITMNYHQHVDNSHMSWTTCVFTGIFEYRGQSGGKCLTLQIWPSKLFRKIVSQNNFKSRVYYFELPSPHRLQSYVMNNMCVHWKFSVQGPVRGQIFYPSNLALKTFSKHCVSK